MTAPNTPNSARNAVDFSPFGPPQLIEGEDIAHYDELFARVTAAVKPADVIEEIHVCDFVDLEWEVLRWRRLLAKHLAARAHKGLDGVLKSLGVAEPDLVAEWAARKPRAIKRVKRILESAGLTIDAVMAETLYESLEEVKSMDAMIAMAEARRNAALCEIERHRAALACALRRTLSQVEDAQFSALEDTRGG